MKTKLPESISTVDEAKAFLLELHTNGESYHPEDDAHDIIWGSCEEPTPDECDQLNKLMDDIYSLPDIGTYPNLTFDPCGYFIDLHKSTP